jgi:hypothetical protein
LRAGNEHLGITPCNLDLEETLNVYPDDLTSPTRLSVCSSKRRR